MRASFQVAPILGLITLLAIPTVSVDAYHRATVIKGHIIAFRPVDRDFQLPSFVRNREVFLFLPASSNVAPESTVTKLVYDHSEYSKVTNEMLDSMQMLRVLAQRDSACDETYRTFLSNAPRVKFEDSSDEIVGGVEFVSKFKDMKLSPDFVLKCFTTGENQIRVEPSK
jgi:hypothetical protein